MSDSEKNESASGSEDSKRSLPDWAVAVLAVEAVALLIGLAMPVTPSKTGSTWSPSELFSEGPSYLMDVAFWFVLTNVLTLGIGLLAWVVSRLKGSDRTDGHP